MKKANTFLPHSNEPGAINSSVWRDEALKAMIKFAKYHVELATKAANNSAVLKIEETNTSIRYDSHTDTDKKGNQRTWVVDKQSILNSYPLKQIK